MWPRRQGPKQSVEHFVQRRQQVFDADAFDDLDRRWRRCGVRNVAHVRVVGGGGVEDVHTFRSGLNDGTLIFQNGPQELPHFGLCCGVKVSEQFVRNLAHQRFV